MMNSQKQPYIPPPMRKIQKNIVPGSNNMSSQKQTYIPPHMRKMQKNIVPGSNRQRRPLQPLKLFNLHEPKSFNNNYKSRIELINKDGKILHVIQRYYLKQNDLFDLDDNLIPNNVKKNKRIMSKQQIKEELINMEESTFNNLMEYIYYKLWAKYGNIIHLVNTLKMSVGLTLPKGGNEPSNRTPKNTILRELKEETGIDKNMIKNIKHKEIKQKYGLENYIYTAELTNEAYKVIGDKLIYDDDNRDSKNYISRNPYTGLNYNKNIKYFDNRFEVFGYIFINPKYYIEINDNIRSELFDKYYAIFNKEIEKQICEDFKLYLKECLNKIFKPKNIFTKFNTATSINLLPSFLRGGIIKNKSLKNTKKNKKSKKNKKKTLKKKVKKSLKVKN